MSTDDTHKATEAHVAKPESEEEIQATELKAAGHDPEKLSDEDLEKIAGGFRQPTRYIEEK